MPGGCKQNDGPEAGLSQDRPGVAGRGDHLRDPEPARLAGVRSDICLDSDIFGLPYPQAVALWLGHSLRRRPRLHWALLNVCLAAGAAQAFLEAEGITAFLQEDIQN